MEASIDPQHLTHIQSRQNWPTQTRVPRLRLGAWGASALASLLFTLGGCYPIPERAEGINIFPLYRSASFTGTEDSELDILWPLFHYSMQGERTAFRFLLYSTDVEAPYYESTWLFPFYYRFKDIDRDETVFAPFYGRRESGWQTDYEFGPFWLDSVLKVSVDREGDFSGIRLLFNEWRESGMGHRLALLDVLGLGHLMELDTGRIRFNEDPENRDIGTSLSVVKVLELLELARWSNEGAFNDFTFLELFGNEVSSLYRYHRRHVAGLGNGDGETHLFPFYFSGQESHGLDSSEESDGGSSGYTHVWPLYGKTWNDPGYNSHHILYPLFGWESDSTEEMSGFDLLWPLASYKKIKERSAWTFLWIPVGDDLEAEAPSENDATDRNP